MSEVIEIHLHFHEGISPEVAAAAVEAAKKNSNGATTVAAEPVVGDEKSKLIARAFNESHGKMRPLLEFLSANPDRKIPYTEVSQHLGFPTARSLPGLLGAFGRRSQHRYKGFKPFEAIWENDRWYIRMDKETAEIIKTLI